MATVTNKQRAEAVKQIDTIVVGGTWVATETLTLTINNKGLVITIGNGTSTEDVAESIRDAWNASGRLDGQTDATNTNTSNFGGQEFGEFAEVLAVIYSGSTSTVRLIAKQAGKPFTLSVGETSTSGTLTHTASSQAATGPEFWDNGDNWDGGSVPAAGDSIILANSDIGFKYGLPTDLELRGGTVQVLQSFTGWLGLPAINRDNPAKHYPEYRTRYATFHDWDGVTAGDSTFEIGFGEGAGSPLLNIEHQLQHADATCTFRVLNTGTPQALLSSHALNLSSGTSHTSENNDFYINRGSVRLGGEGQGREVHIRNLVASYVQSAASDVVLLIDNLTNDGAPNSIIINGGLVTVQKGSFVAPTTFEMNDGSVFFNSSSSITSLDIYKGTFSVVRSGTITTLTLGPRGVLDANRLTTALTITNVDMHAGSQFIDDGDLITVTNGPDLVRCGLEDVVLRRGKHLRLTKGTVS